MNKKKHTPEQIVAKLRQVELLTAQGNTIGEAVRKIEVSEQTYYRWKKQFGQMSRNEVKRLKDLEKENARLKTLVAELSLDKSVFRPARWRAVRRSSGETSEPVATPSFGIGPIPNCGPCAKGLRPQSAAGLQDARTAQIQSSVSVKAA